MGMLRCTPPWSAGPTGSDEPPEGALVDDNDEVLVDDNDEILVED